MMASRMTLKRQWGNIGTRAASMGFAVEKVLTGRPSIDVLIREGFERGTVRAAKRQAKTPTE